MNKIVNIASFVSALVFPLSAMSAVIGHDQVQPLAQNATDFELKFQPTLKVSNGCVPFPAVDANGNTSGGLAASGAYDGNCSSSTGQIYSRYTNYNGYCAVMYAWYFPKDMSVAGHRHDWENVVVWLTECSTNAQVVGLSYSQHATYQKKTSGLNLSGNSPTVLYAPDGLLDHVLSATSTVGGKQPQIHWDYMPAAARNALTNTDFGKANVSMKDANFLNNLGKAYPF